MKQFSLKKNFLFIMLVMFIISVLIWLKHYWGLNGTYISDLGYTFIKGELVKENIYFGPMGDGHAYIEIQYNDDEAEQILDKIKTSDQWKALPLPDEVRILIYGGRENDVFYEPAFPTEENKSVIPEILEGYFYYEDRGGDGLWGFPQNYTFSIYDLKDKKLYYFKYNS